MERTLKRKGRFPREVGNLFETSLPIKRGFAAKTFGRFELEPTTPEGDLTCVPIHNWRKSVSHWYAMTISDLPPRREPNCRVRSRCLPLQQVRRLWTGFQSFPSHISVTLERYGRPLQYWCCSSSFGGTEADGDRSWP